MAASSPRDRLASRGGARALLSPIGLIGGAVVGVLVAVAGAPVWAAAARGRGGVGAQRMAPAPPGAPPRTHRPVRRPGAVAPVRPGGAAGPQPLRGRRRARPSGPLRDRLTEIAARVDTGVDETWLIAKRGQALVRARRDVDLARVDRQLGELTAGATGAPGPGDAPADRDPSVSSVVASLEAQRAAATRIDAVIARTQSELRVLDARLDETVARAVELTARAGADAAVAGLGSDVDDLVTEMEALRLALDETDAAAGAPPPPRDLPRGGTT